MGDNMARRKRSKEKVVKGFDYYSELYGLLMILIAVIGFGFGPVGKFILGIMILLFGKLAFVPLIIIIVLGSYLILKREKPALFSERLLGLYLIIIATLVLIEWKNINIAGGFVDVMRNVFDYTMAALKNKPAIWEVNIIPGGGVIGTFIAYWFVKAFAASGTLIVVIIMELIGILLFFNVSILALFIKLRANIVAYFNSEARVEKKIEKAEKAFERDKQIVISSNNKPEINERPTEVIRPRVITGYHLPPLSLLKENKNNDNIVNQQEIKNNSQLLEQVFRDFAIDGTVVEAHVGPTVTQYEMELKSGTKVSKVLSIQKELALALAARDVRIQAPIPGKSTIGVELPNKKLAIVGLREILEMTPNNYIDSKLLVGLGKNIMGKPMYAEINNTPHLLVAGATGSGKSICINSIIASILMRSTPQEVKLVLIDPKKVELSVFNGIPHLLSPVVDDPKKASIVLRKIVSEMENRYDLFSESKTKNIAGYNSYLANKNKALPESEQISMLPYIVVIIDELADLMLVASKEVEDAIMRITQMARAAGIHLIVATQRPSTDVITGVVKANIPSRISFAVSSSIDSRTILDASGAEKLLGKGDMLFSPMGENHPIRIQGAYISEKEIKDIVDFVIAEQKASYDEKFTNLDEHSNSFNGKQDDYDDPLYDEVVDFVINSGKVSASLLQRRFRLGYNRAARLIDLLEERGIIGGPNGSKPREVLINADGEVNE